MIKIDDKRVYDRIRLKLSLGGNFISLNDSEWLQVHYGLATPARDTHAARVIDNIIQHSVAYGIELAAERAAEDALPNFDKAVDDTEWHRERIFERLKEVRRRRHEQYQAGGGLSPLSNFEQWGAVWSALLSSWLGRSIPPIPGWLVATMMAALKLLRITWNADLEDSYIDAMNYTALAEELRHRSQTDPEPTKGV